MELQKAKAIATAICYKLQPYCSKINIAGSIRRQKPEVKDIEIICVPDQEVVKDLFDNILTMHNNYGFDKTVKALGNILKGQTTGKYMQIALPEGINLDLFMPDDFDYYRQYAIRTGSADYAHKVIASSWLKKGWCGSDKGLRLITDCYKDNSGNWKCGKKDAELPPVWSSEEQFFEWLGVKWVHPSQRV